ncbi:ABC transporter permease [Acrocarpospora catenulata]|uniref:ABC transporter permease n=1 Tax=Acrocarpospora catenulata TaxID=2836182 RepID=UPI001BDA72D1|nr:ABC transporter permease [Acrocarpospora catenulata]
MALLTGTRGYVVRKVTWSLGTLLFVLVFNFFLFRLLPGDPIKMYTRGRNTPSEQLIKLRAELNRPIGTQFLEYLSNPFASTINSTRFNRPVWELVAERVWPTVLLVGTAILIASVAGIWLGIRSGWRRGGTFDRWTTGATNTLYAMPEFWVGMVLIIALPMFPSGNINTPGVSGFPDVFLDTAWHMVLPVTALAIVYLAEYTSIMRASLVDELRQDYLQLARAKGLREDLVRRRHAVPNALLPTMTLIFLNFGFVIGGAITIETVFSWPGLGLLSYEALRGPDIPLLQATFLLFSIGVVVFTLLADLLYAVLDPRVSSQ